MIIEAATQTTMTICIQIQKRGMAGDVNRGLAPPDPVVPWPAGFAKPMIAV